MPDQNKPESAHMPSAHREAAARYQMVVSEALDGVVVADARGDLTEVNDAACAMLGRPRQELLGLNISQFAPTERRDSMHAALSSLGPGATRSQLVLVPRPDGSAMHADIVAQVLPSGDLLAIIRDATQAVVIERSLRDAHAKAERMAQGSAVQLRAARAVLDSRNFPDAARILLRTCRGFIGCAAGYIALIGEDGIAFSSFLLDCDGTDSVLDPSSPMLGGELTKNAIRTGLGAFDNRLGELQLTPPLPDTHPKLRNSLVAPFAIADRTVGVIGLVNKTADFEETDLDLTMAFGEIAAVALKSLGMREELETSERELRLLFDGARDAIVWANADSGLIIDCNRATEALVGRERSDIIGAHHATLHPTAESIRYQEFFRAHAAGQLPGVTEFEVLHADGHIIPVEINCSTVSVGGIAIVQGIFRDVSQRKRAEQNYQTLFDEMHDGFSLHEIICNDAGVPVDYRFLAVNSSFERIIGLKAADIIGRTVLDLLPDIEPVWIERYGHVALTGEQIAFEQFSAALDRKFEVRAYSPRPGQFAVISVDRTEQRRAEEALRLSETRLRMAQEAASVGTWEWDLRTGKNSWSDNLWPMYHLDRASIEASYDSWLESVQPTDRETVAAAIETASLAGEPFETEWRVNTSDGSERWLLSRGKPMRDENGDVLRYLGAVIDVTDERRARDRLKWTRRKLDEAHRIARIGVWSWALDTDEVTWSKELYTMLGRDASLPIPNFGDQSDVYTPESWAVLSALVAESLESGLPFDVDLAMRRADGAVCWTRTIGSVMTNLEGTITSMHGTIHDITERKAAEEEVLQQRHLLSELASELSRSGERERRHAAVDLHDGVGQTLAAAKIVAQNLASRVAAEDLAEAQGLVGLISDSISEVRGLTDTLSPPALYELGLGPGLHWLAQSQLERHGLVCELELDPDLAGLRGECTILFFRTARELLMNVYRHSGVMHAHVSAELYDGVLVLRVSDEGCGFDLSALGSAGQTRRFGLLSIREEVSLAGGTIEFDTAPGCGTRVDIRIPIPSSGEDDLAS